MQVTYVTIGVDNGALLTILARKRGVLLELHQEEEIEATGGKITAQQVGSRVLESARAHMSYYRAVANEDNGDDGWEGGPSAIDTPSKMSQTTAGAPVSSARRKSRQDWAVQDEEQLNLKVEAMAKASLKWRRGEEELAEKEAKERGIGGRILLAAQYCGLFRDASYYRVELQSLEKKITKELGKGAPKAVKVDPEAQKQSSGFILLVAAVLAFVAAAFIDFYFYLSMSDLFYF
jgi:hypothetical protein